MYPEIAYSQLTGVPGWESPAEQVALFEAAGKVPENGVIVELGAEYGMSASLFAAGAKATVAIVSIDLWPGELLQRHIANLTEAGFYGVTVQWTGDSAQVGRDWRGVGVGFSPSGAEEEPSQTNVRTKVDLLFIDADHSYKGVTNDLNAWSPHMAVGGVIALHDIAEVEAEKPDPEQPDYAVALFHWEGRQALNDWLAANPDWREMQRVDTLVTLWRV